MLQKAVAPGLYEIVHSRRQGAVFVASAGAPGSSRILRLDPDTLAVEAEIPLPGKGFGLALDDAAGRLYASGGTEPEITVIDIAAGAVTAIIPLTAFGDGYHFRELIADPQQRRLYAPGVSFSDSALHVIDTHSLAVERVVPGLGFVATGIALDQGQGRIFISNMQGQIITLDRATHKIIGKAETPGDQLLNLAFDAAGGRIFATDQGHAYFDTLWQEHLPTYRRKGRGNRLFELEAATGREIRHAPVGVGPIAVLHDPARRRIYVTNRGDRTLAILDSDTFELAGRVLMHGAPNSLALDAQNAVLYVTVKTPEGEVKGGVESVVRLAL
ncbi:YncE family protein [Paracoccus sp. J56]|uniref:YncE family protein n=1 Tax=Paracoccus sp. J56 TaxID=935850 RepID=UPI000A0999E0|nr:YncE family protein [Paracoccus sp. J56]SMG50817.1 DNA-binding beta-propeller fold protein YncE [Paracoccus sp. J56]